MLTPEPNGSGWQVTLRSSGVLRFFPAAFLCVWLCGWGAGEWFALRIVGTLIEHVSGWHFLPAWLPPLHGQTPPGPVLVFGFAFLTLWLSLWTWGGLRALRELLGLLCGRDVVSWSGEGLDVRRHALFLGTRAHLDAQDITGFREFRGALLADGRRRATRVTDLGGPDERLQLARLLEAWRAGAAGPAPLPPDQSPIGDFVAVRDESGELALTPPPGPRRAVGFWLGVLGVALLAGLVSVIREKTGASLVVGSLFMSAAAGACLYAATWLMGSRETLRFATRRLERRCEMFGRTWTDTFEPLELELTSTRDAEGEIRWQLVASGGGGAKRTLLSAIDDPNAPLTLGTWIAERTGVTLIRRDDQAPLRRAS